MSEFVCLVPSVYSEFIVVWEKKNLSGKTPAGCPGRRRIQSVLVMTTSVSAPPAPPFPSVEPIASVARRVGQPCFHTWSCPFLSPVLVLVLVLALIRVEVVVQVVHVSV